MSNPLLKRGRSRHLHMAVIDLALAIAAACVWQGAFRVPMQEHLPSWVWPAAAALFLFSAITAYSRHRASRR